MGQSTLASCKSTATSCEGDAPSCVSSSQGGDPLGELLLSGEFPSVCRTADGKINKKNKQLILNAESVLNL